MGSSGSSRTCRGRLRRGVIVAYEANALLPRLFVLDDYERCLSRQEGLYCLGVFELTPLGNSTVYQRIQEYSSSPFAFNRSRLHRGYCVSERCPSRARNATRRFERCVSERARSHALSARLHTLHHCTTHAQHINKHTQPLDATELLFLQIVCAIILLNIAGTLHDIMIADDKKKIGVLMVWSVRANWQRLTSTLDHGDHRLQKLKPLHGLRAWTMLMILMAHTIVYQFQYYILNPQFLENLALRYDGVMLSNGTLVQGMIMISNFLTAYSLLLHSQTRELSLFMLPVLIVKRVVRMAPVHLLLVGFTATWWPRAFTGPFAPLVQQESALCRDKFWSHALFYNNLVEKHRHCLTPSWSIAVDMHLYILSCTLVILLQHRRQYAHYFLLICFVASSLACGVTNYVTGWQTVIYFAVPDKIQGFRQEASFNHFYMSTWGSLPACFLGLYMAYWFHTMRARDYNNNKWLIVLCHTIMPIVSVCVIALGSLARHYNRRLVTAAYVAVDRPAMLAALALFVLGVLNIRGVCQRWFSSKWWRAAARLSLPALLAHWLVLPWVCARPTAYRTSLFHMVTDYITSVFYTYLIAVPISLLVEIPMQRFSQ